ncbi:MAG: phage tail family protein [Archaeoglobaceae archaeon]
MLLMNNVNIKQQYNFIVASVSGRGIPARHYLTLDFPLRDGEIKYAEKYAPRVIQVSGYIYGSSISDARQKLQQFMDFLPSVNTLTFLDTNRSINVTLGTEQVECKPVGPVFGAMAYEITITFIAFDPYFYAGQNKYLSG